MNKRKILGAVAAALCFALLMLLFDRNMNPENFGKGNYWLKPILQGFIMFFVYLLTDSIKKITWKELFKKLQ